MGKKLDNIKRKTLASTAVVLQQQHQQQQHQQLPITR